MICILIKQFESSAILNRKIPYKLIRSRQKALGLELRPGRGLGKWTGQNYMLSSKACGADNAAAYVWQKGIDEIRCLELVRGLA